MDFFLNKFRNKRFCLDSTILHFERNTKYLWKWFDFQKTVTEQQGKCFHVRKLDIATRGDTNQYNCISTQNY